jgi:hypothetical protein
MLHGMLRGLEASARLGSFAVAPFCNVGVVECADPFQRVAVAEDRRVSTDADGRYNIT